MGVGILGSPIEQMRLQTGADAVRCCPGELKNRSSLVIIRYCYDFKLSIV